MNCQATSESSNIAPQSEERPKGRLVVPQEHRNSKEYPKEKFYSFLETGVQKFLDSQLGELDLNHHHSSSEAESSSPFLTGGTSNGSFGSFNNNSCSLLSQDLCSILEDEEQQQQQQQQQQEQIGKHKIVLPDISKYMDDTDSDDSSSDDEDDASFLSDSPLNDIDTNHHQPQEEEEPAIKLLTIKSDHSLYERRDSSDDGSDWEEESCDGDELL